MSTPNSVNLKIEFRRVYAKDSSGVATVYSRGWPFIFMYTDNGIGYQMTSHAEHESPTLNAFCAEVCRLMRDQFANCPSSLSGDRIDKDLSKPEPITGTGVASPPTGVFTSWQPIEPDKAIQSATFMV